VKTYLLVFVLTCVSVTAQTNTVPAVPDRIASALEWASAAFNGLLSLVTVLLAWWGTNKSKVAAVVAPMIKAIESHGSPILKSRIKDAAGSAGVEPALNALVKQHTSGKPETIKAAPIVGALLALGLLSGTGCVSGSKLVRELAKDPATVQLTVISLHGSVTLTRVNPRTNSAPHSINADGSVRVGEKP